MLVEHPPPDPPDEHEDEIDMEQEQEDDVAGEPSVHLIGLEREKEGTKHDEKGELSPEERRIEKLPTAAERVHETPRILWPS